MKKNLLFAFLFITILHTATAQEYTRIWVNNFSDTTATWHTNDMAVDAAGNAYITGYFYRNSESYYQTHLFLTKIDAAGKQEWTRYFTNTLDSIDAGTAVAVDSAGYIYVTGSRVDTVCNICTVQSKVSDIITMKYDAGGNRVWLNRYHDSLYILAKPAEISVQPNGTLCIVGNEDLYNLKTGQYGGNMLLQKINASGKTMWLRKKGKAVGAGVCFDKNNNVIVVGASDPANLYQTQKPAVYKYNASGVLQSTIVYDEKNKNGRFYLVACDKDNNIYVNGQTDTVAYYNNPQILTAKYTAAGAPVWYRKEQGHSYTTPHYYGSFALDAAGNSYVTGYLKITDLNRDIITTKYNSAGTRQWIKQFDGPLHAYDTPVDLALDKKGNVYVTGSTSGKGGYQYVSLGYTGKGVLIGVDYYSRGAGTSSFANSIGVDITGNVLITGIAPKSLVTIKYGRKPALIVQDAPKSTATIHMYPNPAKDNITVLYNTTSNLQKADCIISDMYGNMLMQKEMTISNGSGSVSFTLQSLHTGIYVIKIKDGITFTAKSFLKE